MFQKMPGIKSVFRKERTNYLSQVSRDQKTNFNKNYDSSIRAWLVFRVWLFIVTYIRLNHGLQLRDRASECVDHLLYKYFLGY